jgi:hypothetical protein
MTPDSKVVDVRTPNVPTCKPRARPGSPTELNRAEEVFLMEWMRNGGDHVQALKKAGYSKSNADHRQAHQILEKIDRACDVGDVFDLAGYGAAAWVERILSLAYSDNLKARAVAVRLWGLARQYFSGTPSAQGASIHVNVLQANTAPESTHSAGLLQVQISGQRQTPSQEVRESRAPPHR